MTEKETQFITLVQTGLIVSSTNTVKDVDQALKVMENAFYAMKRIPDDLNAHRAARNFLSSLNLERVA